MSWGPFVDRKFRLPRLWSNQELRRIAPLFSGAVANVSAWRDEDKEGGHYRDYFCNAASYTKTNYEAEARGFQGTEGEIFLDLERPLDPGLAGRFDVVFSHTVLEHVFDVHTAFANLCALSRDVVLLCVPFLQPMHDAHYGDFWRFTPLALDRLFREQGFQILRCRFNGHRAAAVYLFAVASRHPERWAQRITGGLELYERVQPWDGSEPYVGCHALPNHLLSWRERLRRFFRRPRHRGRIHRDGDPRHSDRP